MIKLLAVDDDMAIRNLLRVTLAYGSYDYREATNGLEALEKIRDWKPDLVLLDIMMPGDIDGLQVCREVKQDPTLRHIFIAMLTASTDKEDMAAGREAGANAYLMKPFRPMELTSLVSRFAAANRQKQEAAA